MEISQKRNSNRIRYEFGEDELHYSLQDSSGSRTFSVAYTDTSRDRQTLEKRNARLRNAVIIAISLFFASCQVGSSVDRQETPEGASFAVNVYEICSQDTESGDRLDLPSASGNGSTMCVNSKKRVIGFVPDLVRVISFDEFGAEIFMRCERPAPDLWQEVISKPSRVALVANGRVLSDFHTTGDPILSCGIFTASDVASATAMCREIMSAWGKNPSLCEQACRKPEDLSEGTCVEH